VFEPIVRGGIVMIPLLLCSIVALIISIERWLYLRSAGADTSRMMSKLRAALERGSPEEARGVCEATPGPVARVLAATVAHFDLPKEDLREVAREVALAEQPELDKRLPVLATVVTIAPLLGLLGTIAGLMRIFHAVSGDQLGGTAGLSGGIAEALITTFTGLAIAIPFLVVYNALSAQVDGVVNEIELRVTELLNLQARTGARL
jgi:biopolymer transport protein ExbB